MKSILIVDDHAEIREVLRKLLEEEGYEVRDAPDADTAIMMHRKHPADILITDICMPEKSGLEIIEELRKDQPDLKILAISGGPGIDQGTDRRTIYGRLLGDAQDRGADITLCKPFERAELLKALDTLFQESEPKTV